MRILLLGGLVLVLGCGGPRYAPVSGKVTLNGDPLPDAVVQFQPVGDGQLDPGPGSTGRTDANGQYTLEVVGGRGKGAVVGKHRVIILPALGGDPESERRQPAKVKIPPRYNHQTELTFDVKPGDNRADFKLTSP